MFLDDLVTLLVNAGLGTPGTSIFWSSGAVLPTTEKAVCTTGFITIQETGGAGPVLMHNSDTIPGYQRPAAQIVCRAKTWAAARLLAQRAYGVFIQKRTLTLNGVYYVSIDVVQEPFDLGMDTANLVRAAFNIRAVKRPEAFGVPTDWIQGF